MTKNLLTTVSIVTILSLFQGCASLAEDYKANKNYYNTKGRAMDQNRSEAKAKFIREKTNELINAYGNKRGYLIAQKALTDENIQFNFDSQNFSPFIDNAVLVKYINETRNLEDDKAKETIIIIRK